MSIFKVILLWNNGLILTDVLLNRDGFEATLLVTCQRCQSKFQGTFMEVHHVSDDPLSSCMNNRVTIIVVVINNKEALFSH